MAIKTYNPTSPARRFYTTASFEEVTKKTPEKSLLKTKKKMSGRNNTGRITVRHHGGGNRIKYREIDFRRNKDGIPAKVAGIEYDPNRTAYIALLHYVDGEKRYILSPKGLKVNDMIMSGEKAEIKVGNTLRLKDMPVGTVIHNIELQPGKGGQIVRSAGGEARLMARDEKFATIKLPSGETRLVPVLCKATIGTVGNFEHEIVSLGKAGRVRHMGIRPTVRGSVMNPVDHPHGGGEGKSPVGRKSPQTPWSKPALGFKTRNRKKSSTKLIIKRVN